MKEHLDIEIGGDNIARLKELIERATAITPGSTSKMCRVVRRAALVKGHSIIEFTKDSTNAERAQAACRWFSVARELGIETGSIESSDWREWLDHLGMVEEDGEPRPKPGEGLTDGA